jgi:hypothetical protein
VGDFRHVLLQCPLLEIAVRTPEVPVERQHDGQSLERHLDVDRENGGAPVPNGGHVDGQPLDGELLSGLVHQVTNLAPTAASRPLRNTASTTARSKSPCG